MAYSRTTTLTRFIPQYWDAVLGENLYPNLYLYQFGTKRTVPRNFGKTIRIPRLKKQNIVAAVNAASEGKPITTNAISSQTISGTMNQYAGAYAHSDLLVMTALSDVIDLSLKDIARDLAYKIDLTIRDKISGIGLKLSAKAAAIQHTDIIKAVVTLDGVNNPRPPDGHYPVVVHPNVVYDIMSSISSGAWLDVTKYTDSNAGRIYRGEVGRLYGARFVTSSNLRNDKTISTGVAASGSVGMMFAPDPYFVTEINDMTARTYVKQLGSAGAADPVNQYATVGAKVYFGVVPATWTAAEYRMIRLHFKDTL